LKDLNLWDIQGEMDTKQIKYRITLLPTVMMNDRTVQQESLRLSLPSRTIFKRDEEILIYINSGG
jgi:hypothetical protein